MCLMTEKLADLRSSLMHWAGITDRDWETVSRDAKATISKPKADEISDKSFTRKATMGVNVATETLVKTLVRKDESSFLQVFPRSIALKYPDGLSPAALTFPNDACVSGTQK